MSVTMNKKIALFTDLHLGIHQNSLFWHGVALKWTDWFVSELEKKNIKDIIFMGDFFDHRDEVAVNTLHVGYQVLSKLKEYNIIMIPGNHDSFYRDHAEINSLNIVQGWSNIQLLNKTSQLMLGTKLATFVPWGGDVNKVPKSDYVFGHLEINTFRLHGTKVCDKGIEPTSVLNLSPRVYSGHFHLRDKREYQNSYINYVGNPFEMNFGDINNQKGVYILDLNNDTEEFITNDISPKHCKIFASEVANTDVKKYKQSIANNIVKLIVDIKISADAIDKIQKNIILYKPALCTVEFLLNINDIDMLKDISADMSGVNIENSITQFVNNLEIKEKKELISECLGYYNNIK